MKLLMNMPVINKRIREKIREFVLKEFGGNAYQVVVGGAPLNKEIENFFLSIGFPIAMAYGTTETAPFITFANQDEYVAGSCGIAVKHMAVKVLSDNPEIVPGELVCRGINVMKGYYKNQEATDAVIDKDGWFHTGDLATISKDGHFFVKGRSKNMLLGPNGQNIYPEEIEDKLNSMAMVNESIVLQKGDKLVGLVHPDMDEAESLGFTQVRQDAIKQLAKISDVVLIAGSKNSSNSNRLKEVADANGAKAYLVDDSGDIDLKWLSDVSKVGVSAGASAPEYIVKEIIEFLQKNGATDIVEVGSDLKEKSFPLPKEVRP